MYILYISVAPRWLALALLCLRRVWHVARRAPDDPVALARAGRCGLFLAPFLKSKV